MFVLPLLFCFWTSILPPKYAAVFKADYQKALKVYQERKTLIRVKSQSFGQDPVFAAAIVFPEWIRYSYFFDMLETESLEWMYIQKGTAGADFSIGQCQMKPSFVEKLETEIAATPALQPNFSSLLVKGNIETQRQTRLTRLQSFEWQWQYLMCFLAIMDKKWGCTQFENEQKKLAFYATAYNLGWDKTQTQIETAAQKPTFPYGTHVSPKLQHRYADVAQDFYQSYNQP